MLHKGLSVHHRDLKPNNIGFVLDHATHTLQWKVFDFSGMKRDLIKSGPTTAFVGPWCAPEKWSTGRKRARSPLSAPLSALCSPLPPCSLHFALPSPLPSLVCCGPCSLRLAVWLGTPLRLHCCDVGSGVMRCYVCDVQTSTIGTAWRWR